MCSPVTWSADFQKGLTAARNGDYATALKEWTPLADKQHDDSRIVKKLDVKICVVERAINNIGRADEPMTSSTKLQLNKFLQIDD